MFHRIRQVLPFALTLVMGVSVLVEDASAQFMSKRQFDELFPEKGRYRKSFWHFAPGITRTFSNDRHTETLLNQEDTLTYQEEYNTKGSLGLYVELGRYIRLYDWVYFEYFDYALSFKQVKGQELFEGTWSGDSLQGNTNGTRSFNDYYLGLKGGLNNVIQVGDRSFLQNTLGAGVDYRLIEGRSGAGDGFDGTYPPKFQGHLYYKFGFGWRVSEKWYVIPSLETPVLNLYKWSNGLSTLEYFHTRHRPVILSLRFLILDETPAEDCPPVPGGVDSEEKQRMFEKSQ